MKKVHNPARLGWVAFLICAVVAGLAFADPVRVMPHGVLSIPAGSTSGTISVPIQGDTLVEPDEAYTVTIAPTAISTTTATATGTIINDDGIVVPVVSVTQSAVVRPGSPTLLTVTRSGDTSSADRVRWAASPYGVTGASEADFPAVLADEFSGSSLGDEWCASYGSSADYAAPNGCPPIPSDAPLGLWDSSLATVTGGNLRLGLNLTGSDWTAAQVVSKRSFYGGLIEYGVTFPAGKGGQHAIYRSPEDQYYGAGPRSGEIVDVLYRGKTAADANKTWTSQLQYSGPDDISYPAIVGQLNDGTVWSGTSRVGKTRWWRDSSGGQRFAFQVGNTIYWQPIQGDWPATKPWTKADFDENGNPVFVDYPGGGPGSPFDRPFRIVMQSGVGAADSGACSGETSCPAAALSGTAVLVDYVRYYQYPTGEVVFQPGQSAVTLSIPTRDSGVSGVRRFAVALTGADNATVSATSNTAVVDIDPNAGAGVDHGAETYALDFGLNAGGFADQNGVTWANGNQYVTGGTAVSDVGSGAIGGWTSAIDDPPEMIDPLIVTDKCPGDVGWPTNADMAGRDVKITFPTDRDCTLIKAGSGGINKVIDAFFLGGTQSNPARNMWLVGGATPAPPPRPQTDKDTGGWPNGWTIRHLKGEFYWEGPYIDMGCTCRDAIAISSVGNYEGGKTLTGDQPLEKTPKIKIVNSILQDPLQCTGTDPTTGEGAVHGDIIHSQGNGTRPQIKLQNVVYRHGFQGLFLDAGGNQPVGAGASRIEFDHVVARKRGPDCTRIPTPGTNYSLAWFVAPRDGVWFNHTYFDYSQYNNNYSSYSTAPAQNGFTSAGCATYAASAGVRTPGWCKGPPPEGDPVIPSMVGRNYSRSSFTGGAPPSIAGATVPRLDHTRLTGSTLAIVIPVDTTGGRQRVVTMGFSARDETGVGGRTFDVSGAVVRNGFDIYASAGGRDTETRLTAPVTVDADGYLRITLTGVTGDAQINWLTITRPTVGVTLDKSVYAEGDSGVATFTRNGPTEQPVSMGYSRVGVGDYPADGDDFGPAGASGTATFPSGATTYQVPFTVTVDGLQEPDERFEYALTGGVGADIDTSASRAVATISASTGTGGGGGDECAPVGATHKTIRLSDGAAIDIRKTGLVFGAAQGSAFRGLNTKCTTSNVCVGRGQCILGADPKGLQADTAETKRSEYLHIDPVGKFNLSRGQQARDAFVYQVCTAASCSPMIADIIVTGE